ncbi:hypothetical protein H8Z59_24615 [Mycolicibacterium fortuitum]|uniref:hypothetical protein n=1 Tax=Mycolicibacterium fortuitum TaxID=1766 RepID=UPI001CDBD848|nr:hypothetical protein [Mycolicibacterium fortuitum]UBV20417.1 hypothetical protein H8Z59_24615 [Mycolicibacterium fortuitum]
MATVRITYSGMRVENTVPAGKTSSEVLDQMYERHGITPMATTKRRGRVDATGATVKAEILDDANSN